MPDNNDVLDFVRRNPNLDSLAARLPNNKEKEPEGQEASCAAFGFLRGLDARALAVELRFKTGNSEWFPYSWLGPWRFNPSAGLLLKFTGDVVTLVMIRGSNLDALVNQSVSLTQGFQRHRITFAREMDQSELRKAGEGEPTIDRIEVAEFESQEELREWMQKEVPTFVRKP